MKEKHHWIKLGKFFNFKIKGKSCRKKCKVIQEEIIGNKGQYWLGESCPHILSASRWLKAQNWECVHHNVDSACMTEFEMTLTFFLFQFLVLLELFTLGFLFIINRLQCIKSYLGKMDSMGFL